MQTDCTPELFEFQPLEDEKTKRVAVASFDGGHVTSDGGGLLLKEVERRFGLLKRFSECFVDHRKSESIEHTVYELVAQRVLALALGYEDLNDHDVLRLDPLLASLVGKRDVLGNKRVRERDRGKALAGKSTLNRLELTPVNATAASRYKKIVAKAEAIERFFVDAYLSMHPQPPEEIVLDLDATDDRLHGCQEGRFFHGYYGDYCYLPLYIFCGDHLLCAKLRPSNIDGSAGAKEELERIVGQIRERWPKTRIVIRGDSGFCREEIMAWCEGNDVDYVLGLARNSRLQEILAPELQAAKQLYEESRTASRLFKDFCYRTQKSWSRERRVVGKAEHLEKGANPRFVVSSLSVARMDAQRLYENLYCARGEMENRIKEQQLYLFADRTSTAHMRSNQLRLWFSSVAYTMMNALRQFGLKDTEMESAQCGTLRTKLLKIGALVRVTVRRIRVHLASGCPYQHLFAIACRNLSQLPVLRC